MTHAELTQFFALMLEGWTSRNPETLSRAHAEDGTVVSPLFRKVTGRPAILQSYRSLFAIFPDWEYHGDALIVDGTRVAQPFTVQATHVGDFMGIPGSGRKCEIQGVCLFDMAGGLIAHERRIYDFTGLLIRLGILRGTPARPI